LLDSVIEDFLQIPELADRDARNAVVAELAGALQRPIESARSEDHRLDLRALVTASAAYSGGLRALARIVRQQHPTAGAEQLVALVDGVVGPEVLSAADRAAFQSVLKDISVVDIADAVDVLGDVPELRSLKIWRNIGEAIRAMERLPRGAGAPPVLAFAERLAEIEEAPEAERLRGWLALVSPGLLAGEDSPRATAGQRSLSPATVRLRPHRLDEAGLLWGNVPTRNRHFTGRVELLDQLVTALKLGTTTSVLPQALRGIGGVGKTQLVVEFVYRHQHEYDLVWWIPAEQTATVLTSLTQLAEVLNLQVTDDRQETAASVLVELAGSDLDWLLVYDNADDPEALSQLIPSTGGHVIVTTRNQAWSGLGPSLEVDVFSRGESVAMLGNRTNERGAVQINPGEAAELAEKLGDLPLALEQAAAWYLATGMPIREYIDLLDEHIRELLDEGKPPNYPLSVAAFVTLALERFRGPSEAAAQLFSMFAYLGGEPIPLSLLRDGSEAEISEPLRTVLNSSIPMNRTVRDLSQHGLAKVDAAKRVQVHRLVQRVLRDTLSAEQRTTTLRNVRNLLAVASPGDPDENGGYERQREIGPHLEPADMVNADTPRARQTVLDHARYLYLNGDYENCRYLARLASSAWEKDDSDPRFGPDGEMTLLARAMVANATRTLGFSREAAEITQDVYNRFRRSKPLGPRHEYTLITGNQVGLDMRIAGRYQEALDFDTESVTLHLQVFDPSETYTLRAKANLAVDHRMVGRFGEALVLDQEIAERWADAGGVEPPLVYAYMNMARSYYSMGAYQKALDLIERWLGQLQELTRPGNSQVLLAGRTHAITLRKLGRLNRAAEVMKDNHAVVLKRFGANHEFSVACAVSYANILRETGDLDQASVLLNDALHRLQSDFGERHPLTLAARVNQGILLRTGGRVEEALGLDQQTFDDFLQALGAEHPYTICAGTSLATGHSLAGRHEVARDLSQAMYARGRTTYATGHDLRNGADHPYRSMRAVNLSFDMRACGDEEAADALFQQSLDDLRRSLGEDSAEVRAATAGQRLEGDIECPPT
jgi:tetratricopeptide (TPR) repeat protein